MPAANNHRYAAKSDYKDHLKFFSSAVGVLWRCEQIFLPLQPSLFTLGIDELQLNETSISYIWLSICLFSPMCHQPLNKDKECRQTRHKIEGFTVTFSKWIHTWPLQPEECVLLSCAFIYSSQSYYPSADMRRQLWTESRACKAKWFI